MTFKDTYRPTARNLFSKNSSHVDEEIGTPRQLGVHTWVHDQDMPSGKYRNSPEESVPTEEEPE